MSFNITGRYSFKIPIINMFMEEYIIVKGENLITLKGQSFFLNRCINEEFKPLQYICIGNGVNIPQKKDEQLSNETQRNTVTTEIDANFKRLILRTTFKVEDIKGIHEIGVLTTNEKGTEILISHDTFDDTILDDAYLTGIIGDVDIEYIFEFSTSEIKSGWTQHSKYTNTYWVCEPNEVNNVFDNTTGNGFKKVNDLPTLNNTRNAYFYDVNKTNNLYIHLYHETTEDSPNPNNHEILVQSK